MAFALGSAGSLQNLTQPIASGFRGKLQREWAKVAEARASRIGTMTFGGAARRQTAAIFPLLWYAALFRDAATGNGSPNGTPAS
jgi:hypothetical protein